MKLYQAVFSFEFSEGGSTAVYPTLGEARKRAIEILKGNMEDMVSTADRLEMSAPDRDIPNTSAVISVVELPPVNASLLCEIINSNGGSYASSERPIMTITLPAEAKRPVIKRVEKGAGHEGRGGE